MNNILSEFADSFKPATELVFTAEDYEVENVNVMLACNLNGGFPEDSILAVLDNLSFKDKLNHEFFIVSYDIVQCVNFGAIQNIMVTTRFRKDSVLLRKKCADAEKLCRFHHKILFGLGLTTSEKNLFKEFHICDLTENLWWKDLQNVGEK